ncbi:hypothetical protein HPB47_022947 [Ixodes persulcatus]|uniref:Uncharacterized protein n=1 Tax=Ixodes persulcatus TaxID=34615 RepID=A0AC60Q8Q6_IXOPE|nr:hypothetical protein HPB47_022947 [Ixodes persulcatus]
MDVVSSILDQDSGPQPAGDESPDSEGEQSPMDICEPPLAAAQAPEKVSVFVQTEGVRVCTQSVPTKKEARSIEPPPSGEQTSVNKYIVFETCLEKLMKRCPQCLSMETQVAFRCVGSMVQATITCSVDHGGSPTKVLRLFDIMGIASIQSTQFYEYQRCYLLPAVTKVWRAAQQALIDSLRGRPLRLAGDGRSDSPGFSALYGTYSLLETTVNRIIHLELVKMCPPEFRERTETFKKLESVVLSNHLLRDIPKLSSDEQTFALETFHGVLTHFPSKSVGYCHEGLLARTYIAALHLNSNADRKIR